jgi:imidazolonepropionase-like amidohydrolase
MRLTARLAAAAALVGLAALPALPAQAAQAAQAATVVVTADRLIDVATGARVERPQVVITDGRITRLGRQGDALPEGAEQVDLPGVTLVPGLIDMHVHITSSPLYSGYNSLLFTDSSGP